jgi:hypothetical protein
MPANNETEAIDNGPRSAYDGRADVRLAVVEKRISAVEVDVAVIRTSFATKEDVQAVRNEIYVLTERMVSGFAEQKLEFNMALAKQREEFNAALAKQGEEFRIALARQREEFYAALAKQSAEFHAALGEQRIDLYKMHTAHIWRLYGFASLLMTGVYFIARYVH